MLSAAFFDGGEGDNYKRRNASRPSVIYFHGHSDKDGVREQTACPNNVFSAKTSRANSCSVGVRCEDGDEERSEELQGVYIKTRLTLYSYTVHGYGNLQRGTFLKRFPVYCCGEILESMAEIVYYIQIVYSLVYTQSKRLYHSN